MNRNKIKQKMRTPILTAAALAMMASPSLAVDLVAIEGQWSPDGGTTQVLMWGFAADIGQDCDSMPAWTVGPELTDADISSGNLTIALRNCLTEAVSIIIPGQPATFTPIRNADGRVRSFTTETPADGGATTYTWNGVKAGTYLYQSGTHPAKQVQMGLYGALKIGTYPDTSGDVTLLYSEIDPVLHDPPTAATPLGYNPRYYLVNGAVNLPVINNSGDTSQPTVLSFLNAGLDFHVPALNGGYMTLIAEDGNQYPFGKEQYSVNLAAGKTIEAFWQPSTPGEHVIYDRRGNGMVVTLAISAGAGAPVAISDNYTTDEDSPLQVSAPGVLGNDSPGGLTAVLVTAPSSGTLNSNLAADGSFTYTPNQNFSGNDSFSYKADSGTLSSSPVSVNITVNPINDLPVAMADNYEAVVGTALNVAAPGVLANDTDTEGDALTAVLAVGPVAGALSLNGDGSFDYTPASSAAEGDSVSFTYFANDSSGNSASVATVTIAITAATNIAPVAVDDSATVKRNSRLTAVRNTFSLIANDSDADGTINPSTIVVSDTSRGGTVVVNDDGTVSYKPPRRWRGTDTFTYTVQDMQGEISNVATVRVNVVRKKQLPPL